MSNRIMSFTVILVVILSCSETKNNNTSSQGIKQNTVQTSTQSTVNSQDQNSTTNTQTVSANSENALQGSNLNSNSNSNSNSTSLPSFCKNKNGQNLSIGSYGTECNKISGRLPDKNGNCLNFACQWPCATVCVSVPSEFWTQNYAEFSGHANDTVGSSFTTSVSTGCCLSFSRLESE